MATKALWAVLSLCSLGCASILGIEEATCDVDVDPKCSPGSLEADDDTPNDDTPDDDAADDDDATDDDVPDVFTELGPLCEEYCATVTEVCTADVGAQQYSTETACVAVCQLGMQLGSPGDKDQSVDTAYCRYENAQGAGLFGEVEFDCAAAGLGANDACGDICDVYCRLFNERCAEQPATAGTFVDHEACVTECEGLPRTPDPFDYEVTTGNTLECRLWHIQAAFGSASTHCVHAAGLSTCVE